MLSPLKKILLLLSLALLMLFPKLSLGNGVIYISQIQITGGEGRTKEDFIELFNSADQPFNLKGFRLVKRTEKGTSDVSIKSWTDDVIIPPRGFYLWANSAFTGIVVTPDVKTSATISNDNGVAIRKGPEDTGEIIDSVSWGKAENGFRKVALDNPGANEALIRSDLYDANSAFVLAAGKPRNSSFSQSADSSTFSSPTATPSSASPQPAPMTAEPTSTPASTPASTPQLALAATGQPSNQTQEISTSSTVTQGLVLGSRTQNSPLDKPVSNTQETTNTAKSGSSFKEAGKDQKTIILEKPQTIIEQAEKLAQGESVGVQNPQTADASKAQKATEPNRKPYGYLILAGLAFLGFCALIYWNIFRKIPDNKGVVAHLPETAKVDKKPL